MIYFYKCLLIFRIIKIRALLLFDANPNRLLDENESTASKPKTIFILGCGSSINNLSTSQINTINNSDSIGMNLIVLHKTLKPKYLSVEVSVNSANKIKDNNSKVYSSVLGQKAINNRNLRFIINKDNFNAIKTLIPHINQLGRIFMIQQVNVPGSKKFFANLNKFIQPRMRKLFMSSKMTFGKNASLISLIYLSILRGYSEIVLCGVDLSNEYFWEQDPAHYPEGKSIINMHDGNKHNTEMTSLPASEVIKTINDAFPEIKLFVSSPTSHLSEFLSIYPFNE